jgi:2-haloacid dehalogenase
MNETPPIQAVVFDVGGVLFEWDLRCLLRKLYATEDEARWAFENVVSLDWHFQHDCGRDLAEMVAERSAQFPNHAHAIEAYATRFLETIPGPVRGTAELVEELALRGVPLFAITNFPETFWNEFHPTAPVVRHFRDVVVSGREGLAKPDPEIFALAERRFGHPAEAMLFIDDNMANVDAARTRGWRAHHFTGADRLAAELRERGLTG